MAQEEVVKVQDLSKSFGDLVAVDHVSFSVIKGEVFGILGPNGAGKTTTLEIIEGLQSPSSGATEVLGFNTQRDPKRVKEILGIQLQASAYFDYLTLTEILDLFGSFYSKRVSPPELLNLVGLTEKANVTLKKLSGGQKQRFTVAASLVNDPEVVILDEPTAGLDPQARQNLWELVREVHKRGKTVVITTHYMEEAEVLCDRVAIMDKGRLIALDTTLSLVKRLDAPYRVKIIASQPFPTGELVGKGLILSNSATDNGTSHEFRVKEAQAISQIMRWMEGKGIVTEHMEVVPATLEDVFLSLTGRELRD